MQPGSTSTPSLPHAKSRSTPTAARRRIHVVQNQNKAMMCFPLFHARQHDESENGAHRPSLTSIMVVGSCDAPSRLYVLRTLSFN